MRRKTVLSLLGTVLLGATTLSASAQTETAMIRVVAKFDIKPDHQESFAEALRTARSGTANEPGSLGYAVYTDANVPNRFFVDERYTNEDAVAFHQAQDYVQAIADLAPSASAAPPAVYMLGASIVEPSLAKDAEDGDTPLRVFFILSLLPKQHDAVIERLKVHVPLAREESGNLLFDAYAISNDPNMVFVDERWRTPEDLWEQHFSMQYAQETGELLAGAVTGDLTDSIFQLAVLD